MERPFWNGGTLMCDESLLFIRESPGELPAAASLFRPNKIVAMRDPINDIDFRKGRDFIQEAGSRRLLLPPGSPIRFLNRHALYRAHGAKHSIAHLAGHPLTSLLYYRRTGFLRLQPEITYRFDNDWRGCRPFCQNDRLPKTMNKLRNRHLLRLSISGDSITAGWNATGHMHLPPYRPAWPEQAVELLRQHFHCEIVLSNLSVGGWSSRNGLEDVPRLAASRPDLVLIHYGGNDLHHRDPGLFAKNIRQLMTFLPEAEFILVSPMTFNPDWSHTPVDMLPLYREALLRLATETGSVFLDMTTLWQEVSVRKGWLSLTGNGVNHPNDFGHQLYAQYLLDTLIAA